MKVSTVYVNPVERLVSTPVCSGKYRLQCADKVSSKYSIQLSINSRMCGKYQLEWAVKYQLQNSAKYQLHCECKFQAQLAVKYMSTLGRR